MGHQKKVYLLQNTPNQITKFRTEIETGLK